MLTKNQASQIADGLIAQQQELLAEQQDSRAGHVPFIYRCPEIAKLPKREQAALLRRANSIVSREWMLHLTMFILYAAIPLTWWVTHEESGASSPFIILLAPVAMAANAVLRTLMVRLVVRALARHPTQND